jgi:hypothetical protein
MSALFMYYWLSSLCNGAIEAELAIGIILLLQALETLLSPSLASVPVTRLLISESIVDIDTHTPLARCSMEDVTQVITKLGSLLVESGITGLVSNQRSSKDILVAEGKSRVLGFNTTHSLSRVSLEHENGSIEGRLRASFGGKELPSVLHGGDIILLEVQGEPRVDKAILLAWDSINIDLSPPGQITVVSGLGSDGDGLEVMEGLGDLGIDGLDALLDQPEKNDGLQLLDMNKLEPE